MKKIVQIGLALQIILILVIILSTTQAVSLTRLLYQDASKVTLLMPTTPKIKEPKKQMDFLEEVAQQNHLLIAKYIYKNDKEITIYTTDSTLKGQIQPFNQKKQVLVSKTDFIWDADQPSLTVKPWTTVAESGNSGVYYIKGLTSKNERSIIATIEKNLGTVKYERSANFIQRLLVDIFGNYSLPILLVLVTIINSGIFFVYLINLTKKIALLQAFGWPKLRMFFSIITPFLKEICFLSFVVLLSTDGYWFLVKGGFYAFSTVNLAYVISVLLMSLPLFLILGLYLMVFQEKEIYRKINGKKKVVVGLVSSTVIKTLVFMTALFLSITTIEIHKDLQDTVDSQKYWDQTKNIYATQLRYITSDIDAYRPYQKRLKDFYIEASEKKHLFLFSIDNYQKLSNGEFIYDANMSSPEEQDVGPNYQRISPSGKSVRANINYLVKNPIQKENGNDVCKADIDQADTVWNLLVPTSLKTYETKLTQLYLSAFAMSKYLFEKPQQADGTYDESGLKIHIIYVKNNQKYFTYNPFVQVKDNTIIDPVTIVDTGNLDASFYSSALSDSVFVESDKTDGYSYLLPVIKETKTLASIQNTVSVYDFKAKEIGDKKRLLATSLLVITILLSVLFLSAYSSTNLFLEKNKRKFSIQIAFGLPILDMIFPYQLSQSALAILSGIVLFIVNGNSLTFVLTSIWIVAEVIITSSYSLYILETMNLNQEVKGE
ncbi:hypothetical protein IGI37_001287 [Enterococcus sp. AZ194]|uniref:hypothetical protein n=1 Tax=Enterococcus sp. AZ194 TaxID=2774629 RepID=UPI003F26F447